MLLNLSLHHITITDYRQNRIILFLFLQLILEAILPCYLKHIQQPTYREIERDVINQLIISIKTLINNSEALSKYVFS